MALGVKTSQFGVSIPAAYVRVEQVRSNIFEDQMECVARYYVSNPGPISTGIPAFRETTYRAPYLPEGGDAYAQAYEGAKLLPEFNGASDC